MSECLKHPLPTESPTPALQSPWWRNSLRGLGRLLRVKGRDARRRNSWPVALRLLFWYVVVGVSVGIGQLVFWALGYGFSFSSNPVLGLYVAATFPLDLLSIIAGVLRQRRMFAATALLASAVQVGFTSFFNWEFLKVQMEDFMTGRRLVPYFGDGITWYVTWNWFCIATNSLAAFYLLRYEFRFFRKIQKPELKGVVAR